MLKVLRILVIGALSLMAATAVARAERHGHDDVSEGSLIPPRIGERIFVQDRPSLDSAISQLRARYGPGEVKHVSEPFVRNGRTYIRIKYLTKDEMIVVLVDAETGQIVGG